MSATDRYKKTIKIARIAFIMLLISYSCFSIDVTGYVRDAEGNGLRDVTVIIEGVGSVQTTSSGKFLFKLSNSVYVDGIYITFQLIKAGYKPGANLRYPIPNRRQSNPDIILIMKKVAQNNKINNITIIGNVIDEKNNPVKGALISIYDTQNSTLSDSGSNNPGGFKVLIEEKYINSNITIRVSKNGYFTKPIEQTLLGINKPLVVIMAKETDVASRDVIFNKPPEDVKIQKELVAPLNFFAQSGVETIEWLSTARTYKLRHIDSRSSKYPIRSDLEMERLYSSSDTATGIFGLGWKHSYSQSVDMARSTLDSIVCHNIKGASLVFKPLFLSNIADSICRRFSLKREQLTFKDIVDFSLSTGHDLFADFQGMEYIGIGFSIAKLRLLPRGFQLNFDLKTSYLFNKEGHLETIEEIGKRPVQLLYDIDGKLTALKSNERYIKLVYKGALVDEIVYDNKVSYKNVYDTASHLIEVYSQSELGNKKIRAAFKYTNNLMTTRVFLADTTQIRYDTNRNKIAQVNKVAKQSWEYQTSDNFVSVVQTIIYNMLNGIDNVFLLNPDASGNFVKDFEGVFDTVILNYKFFKDTPRLEMRHNNITKSYLLASCACLPLMVIKSGDTTRYRYNYFGNLVEKETSWYRYTILYDSIWHQPAMIRYLSKVINRTTELLRLQYTAMGQLSYVRDESNKYVRFKYDENGRVAKISGNLSTDSLREMEMYLGYDEYNRITKIQVPGFDNVRISYNEDGKAGVESSGKSPTSAMDVLSMYRHVNEILQASRKPLGIDSQFQYINGYDIERLFR